MNAENDVNKENVENQKHKLDLASAISGLYLRSFLMNQSIVGDKDLRVQVKEMLVDEYNIGTKNVLSNKYPRKLDDLVTKIENDIVRETRDLVSGSFGTTDLNKIDEIEVAQFLGETSSVAIAGKHGVIPEANVKNRAIDSINSTLDYCAAVKDGKKQQANLIAQKATAEVSKGSARGA